MNDYWNDPPEHPEPPECCGEWMEIDTDGTCTCLACGETIEPVDYQDGPEPCGDEDVPEELAEQDRVCPHGKRENCDACDHLADLAYDAARERSIS